MNHIIQMLLLHLWTVLRDLQISGHHRLRFLLGRCLLLVTIALTAPGDRRSAVAKTTIIRRSRRCNCWFECALLLLPFKFDLVWVLVLPLVFVQVLSHGPIREAALRSLYETDRLGVELRLEIDTLQLLVGHGLPELSFVLVILRGVCIHLVCPFLAPVRPCLRTIKRFAFGIYAWREQWLCFLVYFIEAFGLALTK